MTDDVASLRRLVFGAFLEGRAGPAPYPTLAPRQPQDVPKRIRGCRLPTQERSAKAGAILPRRLTQRVDA